MDAMRRLEIIEKMNDKSRVSENGECIMWTGSCKGQRVRYGVMCVNVSLHGSMWVHVSAPISFTDRSYKPRSAGCFNLRSNASHLCQATLAWNPTGWTTVDSSVPVRESLMATVALLNLSKEKLGGRGQGSLINDNQYSLVIQIWENDMWPIWTKPVTCRQSSFSATGQNAWEGSYYRFLFYCIYNF